MTMTLTLTIIDLATNIDHDTDVGHDTNVGHGTSVDADVGLNGEHDSGSEIPDRTHEPYSYPRVYALLSYIYFPTTPRTLAKRFMTYLLPWRW